MSEQASSSSSRNKNVLLSSKSFTNHRQSNAISIIAESLAHMTPKSYSDEKNCSSSLLLKLILGSVTTLSLLMVLIVGLLIISEHDWCMPNPCIHGLCVKQSMLGFKCTCSLGYSGKNCDIAGSTESVTQSLTCLPAESFKCDTAASYRTQDGSCNNLDHPDWGRAGRLMDRLILPTYDDGKGSARLTSIRGENLPSARKISTHIHTLSTPSDLSYRFNQMHMTWGQYIDHDISKTPVIPRLVCCDDLQTFQNPPDGCLPILIPKDDPYWHESGKICMEFRRSEAVKANSCGVSYREQLNAISSFIDAGSVYGNNDKEALMLRTKANGLLKVSVGNHLPMNRASKQCITSTVSKAMCYKAGDTRANVWAGLTAIHLTFVREHNRIAAILEPQARLKFPSLSETEVDELVYQQTRKIVAAQHSVITYNEYLPSVIGAAAMAKYDLHLDSETTYDSSTSPNVVNSFATAAFRYAHAEIPFTMQPRDNSYQIIGANLTFTDMFFQPDAYLHAGQDSIIRGLLTEPSLTADQTFSQEVRDKLFMKFLNGNGLDLAAVNLQRGRDHGLPPYVTYRNYCKLGRAATFAELTDHSAAAQSALQSVYAHVNDIDLYTGGLTEKKLEGAQVGPTFACIIGEQFHRLKYGDRFWFENTDTYANPFSTQQIDEICKITLSRILCDTHTISEVPAHAFFFNTTREKCSNLPAINLSNWLRV